MRVLHLDAGKSMRGGQWQALRLIEGLAAEGIESTLLSPARSPLFDAARNCGVRALPLGFARTAWEARRHDLVHAHDSRSHTLAALAGGAPLIVSRRVAFGGAGSSTQPDPIVAQADRLADSAVKPSFEGRDDSRPCGRGRPRHETEPAATAPWKYRRAARYIAVSEHVKAVLMERGVPAEKISVVYDGVPLIGSGSWQAKRPAPPVLALANADDAQKGAALAAEAAQTAGVELQFTSDPERDLPRAVAFVYITYSEGLGSGALLAMSAGVPVIASNVGGLREIIRHGENGLLVENKTEAIASAIREVIDDEPFAARLAASGRRTVEERFTVEQMVRRTIEVYRETAIYHRGAETQRK